MDASPWPVSAPWVSSLPGSLNPLLHLLRQALDPSCLRANRLVSLGSAQLPQNKLCVGVFRPVVGTSCDYWIPCLHSDACSASNFISTRAAFYGRY